MYNTLLAAGAGAAGGAGLGGLLGQVSDTLSYPRRALWGSMGLPEHGNELVGQTFGMDPQSTWAHALGIGAEVAGDPLTWAMLPLGGLLGGMEGAAAGARAAELAAVEGEVAAQAAARAAAQQAMVDHALGLEALGGQQAARFEALKPIVDVPGIMGGASKEYVRYNPEIAGMIEQWGLGRQNPAGPFTLQQGRLPAPFTVESSWMRAPGGMPPLEAGPNPRELFHLMNQIAQAGPERAAFMGPQALEEAVFRRAAQGMAGELAPSLPSVGGLPADQAFQSAQGALAKALADLEAIRAMTKSNPLEAAALTGASGATGAMLGANAMQPRGQRYF